MNCPKITFLSHIRILFFICCLLLFTDATVCVDAKIVYCVDGDIYVRNDDGTNRRRLTKNTVGKDLDPNWSPDGTQIAFIRRMGKEKDQTSDELFIMNAGGTELQRLTHDDVGDASPITTSSIILRLGRPMGKKSPFGVNEVERLKCMS